MIPTSTETIERSQGTQVVLGRYTPLSENNLHTGTNSHHHVKNRREGFYGLKIINMNYDEFFAQLKKNPENGKLVEEGTLLLSKSIKKMATDFDVKFDHKKILQDMKLHHVFQSTVINYAKALNSKVSLVGYIEPHKHFLNAFVFRTKVLSEAISAPLQNLTEQMKKSIEINNKPFLDLILIAKTRVEEANGLLSEIENNAVGFHADIELLEFSEEDIQAVGESLYEIVEFLRILDIQQG